MRYPVEFLLTEEKYDELVAAHPAVATVIEKCKKCNVPREWDDELEGTWYRFPTRWANKFADAGYLLLVNNGVPCRFDTGIWIEGPKTAANVLVPEHWPNAAITTTDEEGENPVATRRNIGDVTSFIAGNTKSIYRMRIAEVSEPKHYTKEFVETPEVIALYRAALPTGTILIRNSLTAWLIANVTNS